MTLDSRRVPTKRSSAPGKTIECSISVPSMTTSAPIDVVGADVGVAHERAGADDRRAADEAVLHAARSGCTIDRALELRACRRRGIEVGDDVLEHPAVGLEQRVLVAVARQAAVDVLHAHVPAACSRTSASGSAADAAPPASIDDRALAEQPAAVDASRRCRA